MKKRCFILLSVILILSFVSNACGAGYTLPEKMQKQLQVGSGLKGSFVIHCNADPLKCPAIHAVQNAEFEVRGIQYGENLHYYIYQPGEGENRDALTEFCRIDNVRYFRSDLLDEKVYILPDPDHILSFFINAEGENPPVLPDLLHMVFEGESGQEGSFNTEPLEKQLEIWISAFSSDTSVLTAEDGSPRLSQTFRIPVAAVYDMVNNLIVSVTRDPSSMAYLEKILTPEQMDIYLNPKLDYYYTEAMKSLNLEEDIVFCRTVSTMGELIQSSLLLPLDASRTGYSSITFESSESRKSFLLSGPKGILYLELPAGFDPKADSYEGDICFARINTEDPESKNISLKIHISKKHNTYEETDEEKTHETDSYSIHAVRETGFLPESISAELIPDMPPVDAEIEAHYSSKLRLSDSTILELSVSVKQGDYDFSMTGQVKTAPPWVFTPFNVQNAVSTDRFKKEDFSELKNLWLRNAEEKLIRTPEEIQISESSGSPNP